MGQSLCTAETKRIAACECTDDFVSVLEEVLVDLVELGVPDLDEGELVKAASEGCVDRVEQLLWIR